MKVAVLEIGALIRPSTCQAAMYAVMPALQRSLLHVSVWLCIAPI